MSGRVLILTHEMLPFAAGPASGGGLRVHGIANGLRHHGFEVVISMPRAYLEGRADVPEEIRAAAYDVREMHKLVRTHRPDVVVLEQPRELGWFEDTDVPVVVDLPGPVFLENQYLGRPSEAEIREKVVALSYGDLFLTSHARQKSYFLAWLALAGVDITSDALAVVPFGFDPDQPERGPRDPEPTFVYAGIFHPWQDPVPALTQLAALLDERGTGRIDIIGGAHPVDIYGEGRTADPRDRLPESERVRYHPLMPWDAFNTRLSTAWIGFNLQTANIERENAFPIRELNYLWSGLPPMVSPTSPFGSEILQAGAGWVVDHTEPDALRTQVSALLDDPSRLDTASSAARALAAQRYTWDTAVEPLVRFCRNPTRRKHRGSSFLVSASDREVLTQTSHELGKVAEAHANTQQELERRNVAFDALQGQIDTARQELADRVADLERATAALDARAAENERERASHAAALARVEAHKEEVVRRLAADLEQHRRRADEADRELHAVRRSYPFRTYRIARRLTRPAVVGLALGAAMVVAWLWTGDALAWVRTLRADYPTGTLVGLAAGVTFALVAFLRLRFRWRWLTPTRARWLGAIKLAFLFVLSLMLLVYLKIWEKLHRIRVFP